MKKFTHVPESELADLPEDQREVMKGALDDLVDMLNDSLIVEDSAPLRWLDKRSTRLADTVRVCNATHNVDEADPMPVALVQDYQKAMADSPGTLMIRVIETMVTAFMASIQAVDETNVPAEARTHFLGEMYMLCVSKLALSIAELETGE